ncbi:MAG: peptidyl-prolyl cis-trans isomerase D [Lentimonas sp.]|jgi:peptidyl-prolyl cis-trans isomerase D
MISWIQNHLIRHGRWIFLTLLTVIIVAFVFTIGNTPGCTSDQSAYKEQNFYGYDLNSPHQMGIVSEKVSLSAILNTGRPIQNEQQFQSQVTSRIALLHLAEEIGVPAPNQKTLEGYIKTRAAFSGPDGQFSRDAYTSFVDNIESNPRMPQGLFVIVLEEDYRIDKIGNALSGPGYLLPSEALAQAQRNETSLKLATAEINYTDFTPEVAPTQEALTAYYTANTSRYEIPERIKASYITFSASKYADQAGEAEESELRKHFIANRARFIAAHEAAQPKAEDADAEKPLVTFDVVRDAVATDLAGAAAKRIANEAAQSFAYTLYRDNIEQDSAAFNKLLNESNVTLTEIAPYTAEGAARRALSKDMLESAFALSKSRYFSDAYELDDGFGVLFLTGRIAPEIPAFETVAAVVSVDYTAEEKRRLFNENGERLETELKAKIAEGTSFVEAAESLGLKATANEAFKVGEAPRTFNPTALQKAQSMEAGDISPMLTSGAAGTFVYVEEKTVPEIAADDENLTQAKSFLQRYASYVSSNALVSELVAKGISEEDAAEVLDEQ